MDILCMVTFLVINLQPNLPLIIVTFSVTPVLGRSCEIDEFQCIHPDDRCIPYIKPDTPINVYTRFCLNTAKSKFSLVSPVAD